MRTPDRIVTAQIAGKDKARLDCQNDVGGDARCPSVAVGKGVYPVQSPHHIACEMDRRFRIPVVVDVVAHLFNEGGHKCGPGGSCLLLWIFTGPLCNSPAPAAMRWPAGAGGGAY
jgi:hypothetical protein